ncbi:MAG TPA: type II toxin-antitoxin system CcdA family antitoxin [Rhizomicrobium sp.]
MDADIVAEAKARKINISRTLEGALRERFRELQLRQFEQENAAAFESYNRFIAENGLWGEDYREW